MIKFWQKNWFGIEFDSFIKVNPYKQANEEFYDKFYKEFFNKFHSYEELPMNWKQDKKVLADFIFEQIKDKQKVLSIGCGSGFIETELSKKWGGELMAIEPSQNASKWIQDNHNIKLINGYFPNCLFGDEKFDFAYMSYIDYVFEDKLYINILKDIKKYPIDNFLLIGASVYTPNLKQTIKYFIKIFMIMVRAYRQQLWGYQRTIEEHLALFQKAGYKNLEYGKLENGVYWIRAKNE